VRIPVLWREAIFSGGTAVMGVASAWLLAQSDELTALAFSVCLVLIPMFSGVAAWQPFWFTCVPAVVTCLAAVVFLHPNGTAQVLLFTDSVTMIATNTVFTLILAYTLEHEARKKWLLSHIDQLQAEALQVAAHNLHELSTLDPLTGIRNRRQFENDLQRVWAEGIQKNQPIGMLIVDVDFFKRYNDGYGHLMGDRCLKQVAIAIRATAQDSNGLAARLGGEEFGILMPGADAAQVLAMGARVCAAVRRAAIEHRFSQVVGQTVVTVSVGGASLNLQEATNSRMLLAFADDALYQAKDAGRDRAVVLDAPPIHTERLASAV